MENALTVAIVIAALFGIYRMLRPKKDDQKQSSCGGHCPGCKAGKS